MKILIFGLNYFPEPTGTGKYTGEMAAWLAGQGHQVEVIASLPHYPAWEIDQQYAGKGFVVERVDDVLVKRAPLYVPNVHNITSTNRIKMELSFNLNTLKYWIPIIFRKEKFDIVIAVSPPMQVGLLPYIYSVLRKVPWVFHIQDLQVDAAVRLNMLKSSKFTKVLFKIENYLLRKATVVSSITEAMLKRIESKNIQPDKMWLFPNWSDINFIKPLDKNNNFYRRQLGISDDIVVFMYSGNIGEKQGLDLLLDAASRVSSYKNIQFIISGEGAAKDRLVKDAKQRGLDNVNFLPIQPVEKLAQLLAAGDVHFVIQKAEAADLVMPSKLTNILAAGRPVIATAEKGTGLYEVITKYDLGAVGEPNHVEKLVENIVELSNSPERRKIIGDKSREYAVNNINKDNVLKDFEEKLLKLCSDRFHVHVRNATKIKNSKT